MIPEHDGFRSRDDEGFTRGKTKGVTLDDRVAVLLAGDSFDIGSDQIRDTDRALFAVCAVLDRNGFDVDEALEETDQHRRMTTALAREDRFKSLPLRFGG